ncbi:PDZ domain-containing protein [Patescibacteria group bacterium]|nr:PDZ domain-containing protein [Patescibacteria group bacterium]
MREQLMLKLTRHWSHSAVTLTVPQLFAAALVLAGVAFFAGGAFDRHPIFAASAPVYDPRAPLDADLAPLFKTWTLLEEHFVPEKEATTTSEERVWGAAVGLAASYGDDYTLFMPPAEAEIFNTQVAGDFTGVGMEVGRRDGILKVIAPIKDTPAYRAGVRAGDIIVKIDGESTNAMTVEAAVKKIRGPKGTSITLTLARPDEDGAQPFDLTIQRDTIELPTVDYTIKDGAFVIHVYMFNKQAPDKFAEALQAFRRSQTSKLVVDLRNNPGGYMEAATDMASHFLKSGLVVVTQASKRQSEDLVFRSSGTGDGFPGARIVVLLNGGSASASEIFAGALRDHGRATIIGQQSFGKGSVQQVFDVTDKTQVKITIARWLTPKGVSISHQGLTPDIEVKVPEDLKEGQDPTLDRALTFLNTGS